MAAFLDASIVTPFVIEQEHLYGDQGAKPQRTVGVTCAARARSPKRAVKAAKKLCERLAACPAASASAPIKGEGKGTWLASDP